jgi:hypothetical protein
MYFGLPRVGRGSNPYKGLALSSATSIPGPSPRIWPPLRKTEWVVYSKPPFGGPAAVPYAGKPHVRIWAGRVR